MGEKLRKVKYWTEDNREKIFYTSLAVLLGVFGFLLGKLSEVEHKKADIILEQAIQGDYTKSAYSAPIEAINGQKQALEGQTQAQNTANSAGQFVASKKGTAYHLLTCPGAKQIKEENKIYFQTKEEAIAAGYKPAANCPQLSSQ